MNDASPGFAKVQTEVASLLPNEGRSVSPAELVQHAGELSVWFTEEGLRGATAGELFEGYWGGNKSSSKSYAKVERIRNSCGPPRMSVVR
jgi:hypothetical protein